MLAEYAAGLHPAAKDWIHRCWSTGHAHGAQLAEGLGTFRDKQLGLMNSPTWADMILEALDAEGWIVRDAAPSPTVSQVFAGVGGRAPGVRASAAASYAHEFGYSPCRDSPGLVAYIRNE